MDVIIQQQAEREARWAQANREELVERIGRSVPGDGTIQPLPGCIWPAVPCPLKPVHSVVEPSLCVIAQGSWA
jgi:hypothetical protein